MIKLTAIDGWDAYNSCMAEDEWQEAGQIFEVEGRPVIGVTYTWPFVVTKDRAEQLHTITGHPRDWPLDKLFTAEEREALSVGVDRAIEEAKKRGYPLDDWVKHGNL